MNKNFEQNKNISKFMDSIQSHDGDIIIFINKRNSEQILLLFSFLFSNEKIVYLPAKSYEPYKVGNLSYTEKAYQRVKALSSLSIHKNKKIIISDYENIFYKYKKNLESLYIEFPNDYSRDELVDQLIKFGFFRTSNISGMNEFSVNGEVIDIYSRNEYFRIIYEWEKISKLYVMDAETGLIKHLVEECIIFANNEIIDENTSFVGNRKELEFIYPKHSDQSEFLLNLLNNPLIINDSFFLNWINIYNNFIIESFENFIVIKTKELFLQPEELFFLKEEINPLIAPYKSFESDILYNLDVNLYLENKNYSESDLIDKLENNKNYKQIIFCHQSHIVYLKDLLESNAISINEINHFSEAKSGINLVKLDINSNFFYKDYIFYSSTEILGKVHKSIKKSNSKQLKNILIDINNFELDEYVVHSSYGIGIFKGCEIITALNNKHECIKLEYFNNDILYIPIENIDSITKYGDKEFVELDKLGTSAWQKKKAIMKQKSFEYAQKLVDIAAKRALAKSYSFALDNDLFNSFLNKFPYIETEDQIQATNDILLDFNSSIFMDRLICGDVGYGKTEIAIRASFAISKCNLFGNKLVVVIVPTTILCQQHYMSFKKRFSGFNVEIATISRHTSKLQLNQIKDKIKNHEIDIIIGTHALFSDQIEFDNLGLLIIDEEHNFGVKQKEKIKSSRPDIHILSMSATPIPRSLQMSLVGLRDLTIIATPPIGRKNVEIDIIEIDFNKIREILLKKVSSGGISFFVVPRIEDLHGISENLTKYVPELKHKIVHGQMDPKEIEMIIEDFHHARFEILVCTIILGSGIDISLANNIIIYRADMFGLSQLYQLKGRVGRSPMESSAFLVVSSSSMLKNKTAQRIEVMKRLTHSGAGFAVASHDMDIRGFGNIIGEEQSGNIKHVGIELYKEMLEESIEQIKDKKTISKDISPIINLGFEVYISEKYVRDFDERLKIYRHIAQIETDLEISEYIIELSSKYGVLPKELKNLFDIVSIKNLCKSIYIKQIDLGPKGLSIVFSDDHNVGDKIIDFINKYPRNTKLKGENKLVYLESFSNNNLIDKIKSIISEFI